MLSSRFAPAAVASALALAAVFAPIDAHAGPSFGLDANLVFPVDSPNSNVGGGFDARIGNKISLTALTLTPEVKGGFFSFSGFGGSLDAIRIQGGGRLGINAGILEPGVFVHLGYGHVTSADTGAFAYDAGGYLDLTLLPLVSLGVHAAYNEITLSPVSVKTVDAGLHAALTF